MFRTLFLSLLILSALTGESAAGLAAGGFYNEIYSGVFRALAGGAGQVSSPAPEKAGSLAGGEVQSARHEFSVLILSRRSPETFSAHMPYIGADNLNLSIFASTYENNFFSVSFEQDSNLLYACSDSSPPHMI